MVTLQYDKTVKNHVQFQKLAKKHLIFLYGHKYSHHK